MNAYQRFGKRIFDLAIASLSLIVLSPVLMLIAILVRLEDRGPALFVQERTGRDGVGFRIYKFRSMAVGAANVPSANFYEPTVTNVGRIIRRSNLDELPQLFNIVKGEMSIVGPRPPLPSQVDVIEARRMNGALGLTPGLTGWAQVNSFDGMEAREKARLDGEYAAQVSITKDATIVLRTFRYLLQPPPKY